MIPYETFCRLRQLHQEKGLKSAQIAEELELDLKTVEKWIQRPTYPQRKQSKRSSKLDPFKDRIIALLERHPYTAQQLVQQLRSQGDTGGYTILKTLFTASQCQPVPEPHRGASTSNLVPP